MTKRLLLRSARVFWAVLPRFLREPLAIAAPTVLVPYRSKLSKDQVVSWIRFELELHVREKFCVHTGQPVGWIIPTDPNSKVFPTQKAAFSELTARLRRRRDIVLVGGDR